MAVLTIEMAEDFIRAATSSMKPNQVTKLRQLLAKLQTTQSHVALMSTGEFGMINELLELTRAMFPNDGHKANNDFVKFLTVTLGAHLAGVERETILTHLKHKRSDETGTNVLWLTRKETNGWFGHPLNSGSKGFDNTGGGGGQQRTGAAAHG